MDQELESTTLLHCLRHATEGETTKHFSLLSHHEWGEVVQESVKQGIAPLLYSHLAKVAAATDVPTRVSETLRQITIGSALRNLKLYRELGEVLRTLRDVAIPVIVLKGAHLAQVVYGDIAMRPMRDIDLLVRKQDLSRADATLRAQGYAELPNPGSDYSQCHHLHPLIKPGGIPIEIHWTIESPSEPFAIDIDGLWERARPATVAGVEVLVLSAEDLLLHLSLHTSFHHQFVVGLRGCWDIVEAIRYYGEEIDWDVVRRRARQWGVGKFVYLTLRLAKESLGATVPAEVLADLEPGGFEPRLVALARKEILAGASRSISPAFARLWGTMRFSEKATLLARTVFPSPEVMGRTYPASRGSRRRYLYYPVRWKDLLFKYGRSVWRVVRRDQRAMSLVQRELDRAILLDWLKCVD
jgi:hypothetical protein